MLLPPTRVFSAQSLHWLVLPIRRNLESPRRQPLDRLWGLFLVPFSEWEDSPMDRTAPGCSPRLGEWRKRASRAEGCTQPALSPTMDGTGQLLQDPAPFPPYQAGLYPGPLRQSKPVLSRAAFVTVSSHSNCAAYGWGQEFPLFLVFFVLFSSKKSINQS